MNNRKRAGAWRLLNAVMLLSLVLALLPGTALAQQAPEAQPPAGEQQTAQAQAPMAEQPAAPTGPEAFTSCQPNASMEPSAQYVPILREQEVGVTFKSDASSALIRAGFNYAANNTTLQSAGVGLDPIYNEWAASTAVDFNGDRYDEIVTVYKDSPDMLQAVSYVGRPPTGAAATKKAWTAGAGREQGSSVAYIDVAAGNLLQRPDRREAVVAAFRNKDNDLELLALTGGTDGHIATANGQGVEWVDQAEGRGDVSHVSVAVGDLDGDGFPNEVVTAFKDGSSYLQVAVFRLGHDTSYNPTTWQKVDEYRFSVSSTAHWANNVCTSGSCVLDDNPNRGIDVTTGDVDGDGYDEAIVAFADNGDYVQATVLALNGSTLDELYPNTSYSYFRANEAGHDADFVSVAAPDLDGDGQDEVVVAIGERYCWTANTGEAPVRLWTLRIKRHEQTDANGNDTSYSALERDVPFGAISDSTDYNNNVYDFGLYVDIAAVNVDLETAAQELAVAFVGGKEGSSDKVLVKTYRQTTAPVPKVGGGVEYLPVLAEIADNHVTFTGNGYDASLIVGDFDGDSIRLRYDSGASDACKRYSINTVDAVINQPPVWGGLHAGDAGAGYGMSVAQGTETGKTLGASVGASLEIDCSVSVPLVEAEVGPVFTTEFNYSHSVTKKESVTLEATFANSTAYNPGNNLSSSAYGFVLHGSQVYQVYKYVDESGHLPNPVYHRVPAGRGYTATALEGWNADRAATGWEPFYQRVNIAQGKTATQSSNYYSYYASRAVDGNTDGNLFNNSVSHTWNNVNPWWQVDLGSVQPIASVSIWNRSDGGVSIQNRLKNFRVQVSDTGADWGNPKWTSATFTDLAGRPSEITVGKTGRYVRVQILGTEYLSIAEVQVWKDARVNLAAGKTADQSSDLGGVDSAGRAIDGNTDGVYANGSVSHTNSQAGAWWEVNLGSVQPIGAIDIWNRSDGGATVINRLSNYYVKVYDQNHDLKWSLGPFAAAAGFPTPVIVAQMGQYVRIELGGTNFLHLAEVQVWKTREVDTFPSDVTRIDDNRFTITNRDGTTKTVNGNLKWDWCEGYLDNPEELNGTMLKKGSIEVKPLGAVGYFNMSNAIGSGTEIEDSFAINQSMVYEAKVGGVGVAAGYSFGFEAGMSKSLSWDETTYFEGTVAPLASNAAPDKKYTYCPYYYMVNKATADGVDQGYMVLDYYVPCIGATCTTSTPDPAADQAASATVRPTGTEAVQPLTPLINSATHPDPNAWSTENTASFTWQQPAGDPAQVTAYRWFLDHAPATVPDERVLGMDQAFSYNNLADGTWYLHVRAKGVDQWSDTGHRQIRIDRLAPQVTLALDPATPDGDQGWYRKPLTATVTAVDPGSGMTSVQISTDGTTWQPYAAALHYTADTPPTTLWARASDGAGHVSEPISKTFQLDLTAPDSHVAADCGIWGVCQAGVVTDAQGNEHLVLSGQIAESTSGRAGMEIQANDGSWTSATLGEWHPFADKPAVTTNWMYTATLDIGHGYHIFKGRSVDGAGNLEEPYMIAQGIWYPLASPDLSQSSITIEPAVARPGNAVTVTLAVRNGGRQEAHVAISTTLPAGLVPAAEDLAWIANGTETTYNPATGVITWPEVLLWPGQSHQLHFRAIVAAGVGAGNLTAKLNAHAFWPNTNLLPPAAQQFFTDHEATVAASGNLTVDPLLPASRDITAPHVQLAILNGELMGADSAELALTADADAAWMYLREWTVDPVSGAWIVARNSGWVGYKPSLTWALSAGGGVKYIGAWVADMAGNISRLDEASLAFTNRLIDDDLLAGQRRQYRFTLGSGLAAFNLLAQSGQADLYAWIPGLGQYPSYVGVGTGILKAVGFRIESEGIHLIEAAAIQDSTYTLLTASVPTADAGRLPAGRPALPNHPLTMSTPLTGGAGAVPQLDLNPVYFPVYVH